MSEVLVTGGSGFVSSHAIVQLLNEGHRVRATIRSLGREAEVRALIESGGVKSTENLRFYSADLESDAGWSEATAGCEFVLHIASPFPGAEPKDENELIVPARDGALRVMKAARAAGVKRVVLTSSFAAIGYGHPDHTTPFDETSWTNIDSKSVGAYHKSKAVAERAAWDFYSQNQRAPELVVINPVGIFGPTLGKHLSSSLQIIQRMMNGEMPGCPKIYFGVVDVRDVVSLHLLAMTHPKAAGERFIATACESTSLVEIAQTLKRNLGDKASKVSARQLPNWLVRAAALFNPEVRGALPELGVVRRVNGDKARRVLGWKPKPFEEAIIATGKSLIDIGLVR